MQLATLDKFKMESYKTLIYEHHVVSPNMKLIEFKPKVDEMGNQHPLKPMKGFLALKDEQMYLLEDGVKEQLPIKTLDNLSEPITRDGNVVKVVENSGNCFKTFKITPTKVFKWSDILHFFDVEHSASEDFYLMNNIFLAARVGRLNACICTSPGFGKTFSPDCMNAVFDLMPNIDGPRTAPAIAPGISTDGVLRIDELSGLNGQSNISAVENVIGGLADFSDDVSFGTGGSKAYRTMNPPPTTNLSCVITYNKFGTKEQVEKKEASYHKKSDFFDWMFPNSTRLIDRFVRFLLPYGKPDQKQFNKEEALDDELRMKLRGLAKSVAYYIEVRANGYTKGVSGEEPELNEEQLEMIETYVYKVLPSDSRHTKTMREILIFAFLAADKDVIKWAEYANKYIEYMDNYTDMLNADEVEDTESSQKVINGSNVHDFEIRPNDTSEKKSDSKANKASYKASQEKGQIDLSQLEKEIL